LDYLSHKPSNSREGNDQLRDATAESNPSSVSSSIPGDKILKFLESVFFVIASQTHLPSSESWKTWITGRALTITANYIVQFIQKNNNNNKFRGYFLSALKIPIRTKVLQKDPQATAIFTFLAATKNEF
jgi:hypothetical protein